MVGFSLLFLGVFGTINREVGSNRFEKLPRQSDTRRSQLDRLIPVALILSALAGTAIGCSSGPAPLSIKMHNPKTDQSLTCAARDQRGDTDVSMLAGAVENCARSLEARGFVRQK